MNNILPIGSVVKLNGAKTPVMIFGYFQKSAGEKEKIVDYIGVPYPIGSINFMSQVGFQMTDIAEVLFEGYRSEEFKPMEVLLNVRKAQHELINKEEQDA